MPDYTHSTLLSDCSIVQNETIINDGSDYQKAVANAFDVNLSLYNASFQFGYDSKHITNTTKNGESIFAQVESTCAVYQLKINRYKTPNVTEDFLYGVYSLSDIYDEYTYMTFLQTFGTPVSILVSII